MATHHLEARSRRRSGGVLVVVLATLGACAGGRPEPLVAGGGLDLGLTVLAPAAPLDGRFWPAPTLGPAAAPAPLPALRPAPPAPRPPPPKPALAPRVVAVPELKPVDMPRPLAVTGAGAPLRPAPPKPADLRPMHAVEPAAGPVPAPPVITIERAPYAGRPLTAAVAVAEPDALLPGLDRAAREALLAGDAAGALALYERAAELDPAGRSPLLGRALALQQLGREREAQALYQLLLDHDANDLEARIALLGLLAEQAPDEALRLLRRLARHHPRDARVAAQIASALARKGDLAAALVAQRRAVALAPEHPGHQINLAILHDRAGERAAAVQAYRRALEVATLRGLPSAGLEQIAARLQHLQAAPR